MRAATLVDVQMTSRRSLSSAVIAASLSGLGVAVAVGAFGTWVRVRFVGGDHGTIAGVALSPLGWWVFAIGVVLALSGAASLATRSPVAGILAIPGGALMLLALSEVRDEVRDVRGFLRVEHSAYGIANPITLAVQHPIAAVDPGWEVRWLAVTAVLAICIGVTAGALVVAHFVRRKPIAVPQPT